MSELLYNTVATIKPLDKMEQVDTTSSMTGFLPPTHVTKIQNVQPEL
jgi:hypothetical protein